MKSAIILLYPLTALAALPLGRRQSDIIGFGAKTETAKLFKKEISKATIPNEGAKKIKLLWGPYKVRAANSAVKTESGNSMDPAGTAWNQIAAEFPTDITILKAWTQIEFANGTRARAQTGIYNHHVAFVDITKPPPEVARCSTRDSEVPNRMSIFMGNPEDAVPYDYRFPNPEITTGYYIKKNQPVVMTVDVVNYTNDTQTVYTHAEFEYIEGKLLNLADTSLQTLRLAECEGGEDYLNQLVPNLPKDKNSFTIEGKSYNVVKDGTIFFGRGHLHDGGVDISIHLNGKKVCSSEAVYGNDEAIGTWVTIKDMTICAPFKVRKGDKLVLTGSYDFDKHPRRQQHHGGMGELMATLSYNFAQ